MGNGIVITKQYTDRTFKDNIFFRAETLCSRIDQDITDRNAAQRIADSRVFFNPSSIHNIGQVIVPRLDKNGLPVPGGERVCLGLKPVNKCLEHYDENGYDLQELMNYNFFSEGDLNSGYHQFRVSKQLKTLENVK